MKSKIFTACLALFLGIFGIHQLYLRNTGKFLAYFISSILCIGFFSVGSVVPNGGILGFPIIGIWILSFFDFCSIVYMKEWEFSKKYNEENIIYKNNSKNLGVKNLESLIKKDINSGDIQNIAT